MKLKSRSIKMQRLMTATILLLFVGLCVHTNAGEQNWRPKERWRGGNLFGMLLYGHGGGFKEHEFATLEKYGFNFVRLPIDYRYLARKDGSWYEPDDIETKTLDKGVEYARKHHLHVQICFHRIPGYTVAGANFGVEKHNLFRDQDALDAACKYWSFLAKRYKGISNDEMSFNLFNEPSHHAGAGRYANAMEKYPIIIRALVKAIRDVDPERFIIADGMGMGSRGYLPVAGVEDIPNFAWSTRGYEPMSVSHCGAKWVGLDKSPVPDWPYDPEAPTGVFSCRGRKDDFAPFELLNLPPCRVSFTFARGVATKARIRAVADGVVVKDETLVPTTGAPGWTNVRVNEIWKNRVGDYTNEVTIVLDRPTKVLSVATEEGEWARPDQCTVVSADGKHSCRLKFSSQFTVPENYRQLFRGWESGKVFRPVDANGQDLPRRYEDDAMEYLYRTEFRYLDEALPKGHWAMAGEFGVYNKTPHKMALSLLEAYFKLWKERDMGWAVWGFQGSMGVMDSNREGVDYEDTPEGKLDREMYELFKKY